MIAAFVAIATVFGVFAGIPFAVWVRQGCPHVDD